MEMKKCEMEGCNIKESSLIPITDSETLQEIWVCSKCDKELFGHK